MRHHPIQRSKRWFAAALWAVGIVAIGSPARASFIDFNSTGDPTGTTQSIAGIDLAPGNALAQGSLPLTVGKTFQLYYQSTLSGLIHTNGLTVAPTGLNTNYQITAVASFTEVVTSADASSGSATFALASHQASNSFFEMFYNSSVVANNLTGTGFNAGTLILAGTPASAEPSVGIFSLAKSATGQPLVQPVDGFLKNHYPTVASVVGSGSALVTSNVTYVNPAFFKTALSQISFNSSLITPFAQTSPSGMFIDHSGAGNPDVTPNLGTVNGLNGKDFQFQADANASFISVVPNGGSVPEPASLLLASLGMLGVLCLGVRQRTRKGHRRDPVAGTGSSADFR